MDDLLAETEVFTRIGHDGFERLTRAFYDQVPGDPVLGPMYPAADLEGARLRLRDFLIFRFGGPATYIEARGHPRLRARHHPFAIDATAREHWMRLMDRALHEAALPAPAAKALRAFFEGTATFLINKPG